MKLVYVIGLYRGKTSWDVERNIREAEVLGFRIAKMGGVPVIPHTMYRFFNGTCTDGFWLEATSRLLLRCDAAALTAWLKGSDLEVRLAKKSGKPVFDTSQPGGLEELRLWLESQGDSGPPGMIGNHQGDKTKEDS